MIKCRRKKLYNINNRYLSFNSVKNSKKSFQDKKEIFIFLFINSLISSFFIKIENEIYKNESNSLDISIDIDTLITNKVELK